MRSMKFRRAIALLCVLFLTAGFLYPSARADETDTVYVQKHISLLYDNSRSMRLNSSLKWCYASYAAQVFTGLLNDTDTLSITFMNSDIAKDLVLDLQGDRQTQVNRVLNATDEVLGGTPIASVEIALKKLEAKGLLSDEDLGDREVDVSQQYWLVLTTDGQFYDDSNVLIPEDDVISSLASILDDYSNLQLVYFGIGTAGSSSSALDLRTNAKLKAYSNFTAYYVEDQDQIVSTMQQMSNRISGRYDVSDTVAVSGTTVTLTISGESSPIRNIAVLAQQTNAKLVSAVAEDGTRLEISRSASIAYPTNSSSDYTNVPAGTLGGYTALITSPTGKVPAGKVTLTFDQALNADTLSLMYEPAIYVRLTVQKLVGSQWVEVPMGERVSSGDTLRLQYAICEDGSNDVLDPSRLPGKTEALFTCNDRQIQVGEAFTVPTGNTTITATVSLMDGAYRVSTSRTIRAVEPSEYQATVTGALTILDTDLADNKDQYLDFTVKLGKESLTDQELSAFRVDSGALQGDTSQPGQSKLRFTPSGNAPAGEYTVKLCFGDTVLASQTITVITITYTATASDPMSLALDGLDGNEKAVTFAVTVHQGEASRPLTQAEADSGEFRVDAGDLKGNVSFSDGTFQFLPQGPLPPAGDYPVTLYHQDTALASTTVSLLSVVYSAEADRDLELVDVYLNQNTEAITFTLSVQRGSETQAVTDQEAAQFTLTATDADGNTLDGQVQLGSSELRFTPGGNAPAGEYTVRVYYGSAVAGQATVTVVPDPVTYTAQADRELTLFSNEIGTNQEAITFTITAHRDSGDSPLTQEEADKFRIVATSPEGTALSGATAFQDGALVFTPRDPQAAVGGYTVDLYLGDTVLASSAVTILQYNAQYTVEVHVPSNAQIRTFGLIDNETALAFVIYADGEPCSHTVLKSMLQDVIQIHCSPDHFMVSQEISLGYWEGLPTILVRPTSSTDNYILDFLEKAFHAFFLLRLDEFEAELVVNAPKGDAATGTLAFQAWPDAVPFIGWFFVLLTLIVLACMVLWSNARMARFLPGHLTYYKLDLINGKYYPAMRDSLELRVKFHLWLIPAPETEKFKALSFTAASVLPKTGIWNFHLPQCVLRGKKKDLACFYSQPSSIISQQLLEILRLARTGTIPTARINDLLPNNPVEQYTSADIGVTAEISKPVIMQQGAYIMKRQANCLEFWTFVPKSSKKAENNKTSNPKKSVKKARK